MIVQHNHMLLLISSWKSGDRYLLETEIKPYNWQDIQRLIDSYVSSRCSIDAVQVMNLADNTVTDITGLFDVRSAEEIVEASKLARERAFEAPAFIQPYSTVNHATQGI